MFESLQNLLKPENLAGLSYMMSKMGAGMSPEGSWQQGLGNATAGMMSNLQYNSALQKQQPIAQPSEVKIKYPQAPTATTTEGGTTPTTGPTAMPQQSQSQLGSLGQIVANGGAKAVMPPFVMSPLWQGQ